MSDCVLGLCGKDFALLAADASASFSIILMKNSEDKILKMDDNKLLAACGESGDRVQFSEYIQKNLNLYRFRNDRALSTHAAANFLRHELATALRSRSPYQTNMLLAGYEEDIGPELYFIDYLASMQKVPYAAHGYGSYFSLSILDKYYKKEMSVKEGLSILRRCVNEIQTRLLLNTPQFIVKIVDKNGAREIVLGNPTEVEEEGDVQGEEQDVEMAE